MGYKIERIGKKTNNKDSKNKCCKKNKVKKYFNFYISNNISNKKEKISKLKDSSSFIVFEYVKKITINSDNKRQQQQMLVVYRN